MKLSDLKTGMIVTNRKGEEFVVFKDFCLSDESENYKKGIICNAKQHSWLSLDKFNEEMECLSPVLGVDCDIMKVEAVPHPYSFSDIAYEKHKRKTLWSGFVKEVTMAEIEEKFGCKVKIIKED